MPCILVHGGAGPRTDDDDAVAAQAGCLRAARAGWLVLAQGGTALDAVEVAARAMEDDPQFNAGTGSVLNRDGEVEMDACVMDGDGRRAGAVALVKTFANPITLARAVMERSPHVLLAGEGARDFGRSVGLPEVDPARLITESARRHWRQHLDHGHGTVGAVALDARGHLAAATSTGGTTGKLKGRIGDTPLPGCGTWADDRAGAASATGLGEALIRTTLTRHLLDLVAVGVAPHAAAQRAVDELREVGGEGGVILVTRKGELAWAFNTQRMAHAWVDLHGVDGAGFESTQ